MTVEAVLLARLDSLPFAQRETLRAAAVLGRRFWEAGAAALLGLPEIEAGTMQMLEERRFVAAEASLLPEHTQWRFQQGLLFEVAYSGIGARARSAWHGRAALWWSEQVATSAPGRWREIARHFAGAGDHERAATAWITAAREADAQGDPAEARSRLESAMGAVAQGGGGAGPHCMQQPGQFGVQGGFKVEREARIFRYTDRIWTKSDPL